MKGASATMPESLDALNELALIRARIEGIEHTQEVLVRANSKAILEEIDNRFKKDPKLKQTYLLVNGSRRQQDIIRALKDEGVSMSQATVSRKLDILRRDLHLIEVSSRGASGEIYRKAAVDRILGISRRLLRERTPEVNDDPANP